jgi:hypothetical protein
MNRNPKPKAISLKSLLGAQQYKNITTARLRGMENDWKNKLIPIDHRSAVDEINKNIALEAKATYPKHHLLLQAKISNLSLSLAQDQLRAAGIRQKSSFIDDRLETELQKSVKKLAENSKRIREQLQQQLGILNVSYKYFNDVGWIVPGELYPHKLSDIHSSEEADQFMKRNIINGRYLLVKSLNHALNEDGNDMPDNIRILLSNVINALEVDISLYKVMFPVIFSIIDCLIREWLGKYVKDFCYVKKSVIDNLKDQTHNIENDKYKGLFPFYQSMVWIEKFSEYYPDNKEKISPRVTRNSVAHGSFDYTNYTIYDFAKVALLIEHISGLRDFLEENSSNSL